MKTDIQIAQEAKMLPIAEIAEKLGIPEDSIEFYGKYKAKISDKYIESIKDRSMGKLILVTAINPTPAGEGKTTVTVGLGEAMPLIGKKAIIALREPSMGPVMGIKGGAAGGGYSQVVPMEDINLHFTGDMHAITAANNLLSAAIDNHVHHGNALNIDMRSITWKRCLDMNDRALREVVVGLGGKLNGYPRQDGFNITVASEVMAILCLSEDIDDLRERISRIIIGSTKDGKPVTAGDLKMDGAMTLLLRDAIKPNLVQTLENTPCLMHGGPFANIAHGCNSIIATKTGLRLSDYCITEAGFGSDLGAEKFFDIKCRAAGLTPDCVVLVATAKALKYNSGNVSKDMLKHEDLDALKLGIANLGKHIENMKKYGVPVVVAINKFDTDTAAELEYIEEYCKSREVGCSVCEVFEKGGRGGTDLAEKVIETIQTAPSAFKPIYNLSLPIKEKIEIIAREIYGAASVTYSSAANKQILALTRMGFDKLPVCMAKTQYSLSDDPTLLGRPKGFDITIREINISSGAGFLVVLTGAVLTMPGLPKEPAANKISLEKDGTITGLF